MPNTISNITLTLMKLTHQKNYIFDVTKFLYVLNLIYSRGIDGKIIYYWSYRNCAVKFQTTIIANTHTSDDKGNSHLVFPITVMAQFRR